MAEDRRAKLLESAIALFAREGMDAANTNTVAKNAGVAAGTLFNYFRSKTDLIVSAYLHCKTEAAAAMRSGLEPNRTTIENLRSIWKAAIRWHLENKDAHHFMEQFRNSPLARDEQVRERAEQEYSFLCDLVEQAQKRGEIADLPMEYLESVFTALFLSTVRFLNESGRSGGDALVERSFGMLRRAIQPAGAGAN